MHATKNFCTIFNLVSFSSINLWPATFFLSLDTNVSWRGRFTFLEWEMSPEGIIKDDKRAKKFSSNIARKKREWLCVQRQCSIARWSKQIKKWLIIFRNKITTRWWVYRFSKNLLFWLQIVVGVIVIKNVLNSSAWLGHLTTANRKYQNVKNI